MRQVGRPRQEEQGDGSVCVVLTRNGTGDVWRFDSLRDARLHPIPQTDDVYAAGPDQLMSQYGRSHADSLLRFAEGRDRVRLIDALEVWKGDRTSVLSPEASELLWSLVVDAARLPPKPPAEVVRIVVEDRAWREGRPLRSLPGADEWAREASEGEARMAKASKKKGGAAAETKTASAARAARIPDSHIITIATEEKRNPKREGTPSHERFALYEDGMTVGQAKEAGVKAADISYDLNHGYISLEAGEQAAAE